VNPCPVQSGETFCTEFAQIPARHLVCTKFAHTETLHRISTRFFSDSCPQMQQIACKHWCLSAAMWAMNTQLPASAGSGENPLNHGSNPCRTANPPIAIFLNIHSHFLRIFKAALASDSKGSSPIRRPEKNNSTGNSTGTPKAKPAKLFGWRQKAASQQENQAFARGCGSQDPVVQAKDKADSCVFEKGAEKTFPAATKWRRGNSCPR